MQTTDTLKLLESKIIIPFLEKYINPNPNSSSQNSLKSTLFDSDPNHSDNSYNINNAPRLPQELINILDNLLTDKLTEYLNQKNSNLIISHNEIDLEIVKRVLYDNGVEQMAFRDTKNTKENKDSEEEKDKSAFRSDSDDGKLELFIRPKKNKEYNNFELFDKHIDNDDNIFKSIKTHLPFKDDLNARIIFKFK